MHHWQPFAEHMHACEPAAFEDSGAPLAFEKSQSQKQDNQRAELQSFVDKAFNNIERGIGDDSLAAGRHCRFGEKVAAEVQRESVIADVAGNHCMAVIAQDSGDGTTASSGLPHSLRNRFDAPQGFNGDARSFVQI